MYFGILFVFFLFVGGCLYGCMCVMCRWVCVVYGYMCVACRCLWMRVCCVWMCVVFGDRLKVELSSPLHLNALSFSYHGLNTSISQPQTLRHKLEKSSCFFSCLQKLFDSCVDLLTLIAKSKRFGANHFSLTARLRSWIERSRRQLDLRGLRRRATNLGLPQPRLPDVHRVLGNTSEPGHAYLARAFARLVRAFRCHMYSLAMMNECWLRFPHASQAFGVTLEEILVRRLLRWCTGCSKSFVLSFETYMFWVAAQTGLVHSKASYINEIYVGDTPYINYMSVPRRTSICQPSSTKFSRISLSMPVIVQLISPMHWQSFSLRFLCWCVLWNSLSSVRRALDHVRAYSNTHKSAFSIEASASSNCWNHQHVRCFSTDAVTVWDQFLKMVKLWDCTLMINFWNTLHKLTLLTPKTF